MRILFPKHPLETTGVDPDFMNQHDAAHSAGFEISFVDYEALTEGRAASAVKRVADGPAPALLRGWMLKPHRYADLYQALQAKGVTLVNTPEEYVFCHHLPRWYSAFADCTPKSLWVKGSPPDVQDCLQAVRKLGSHAAIVKDYVKSWKHDWLGACFIPDTSDQTNAERVIRKFIELQDSDLNEGVVLRAYADLAKAGVHPISGMPLSVEWRIFVLDKKPLVSIPYWPEAPASIAPPVDFINDCARRPLSRFFTVDLAQTSSGDWVVIELGDGQVAGLQDSSPSAFYGALADVFRSASSPAGHVT